VPLLPNEFVPAQMTFEAKSEPLENPRRGVVAGRNLRIDPVRANVPESEINERANGLGADSFAPPIASQAIARLVLSGRFAA